jgi:protoporphyrinogen oxidase
VRVTAPGRVVVAGAGPAGLAAARDLAAAGVDVLVCERGARVGGLARTESFRGYRFDVGGHRFFTRVPEIQRQWVDALGNDFLSVPRLSRIFYRGRFFDYPVNLPNVVRNLGGLESACIVASYLWARTHRSRQEQTFEGWVTSRFGRRLYEAFFRTYTEKVWGMPCSEIRADWAAQRIRGVTLGTAIADALGGRSRARSLVRQFHYPRLGAGQMWERFADLVVAAGGTVRLGTAVNRLHHDGRRVDRVEVGSGPAEILPVGYVISSLPLASLLARLDPPPPSEVLAAGRALRHRDFILVGLIIDAPRTFPDTWLYVHGPEVLVGRIQNFKNWSEAMVPDARRTSLGMEYFCSAGDAVWSRTDAELLELASRELQTLGLAPGARVEDGCVIREEHAYPVYDGAYRASLSTIRGYLAYFENLQTVGRGGMHRYNNQDHSMLTGQLAARNVLGARRDVWAVDADGSYIEDPPGGG